MPPIYNVWKQQEIADSIGDPRTVCRCQMFIIYLRNRVLKFLARRSYQFAFQRFSHPQTTRAFSKTHKTINCTQCATHNAAKLKRDHPDIAERMAVMNGGCVLVRFKNALRCCSRLS